MLNSFRTKKSNVLAWALMVLLIIGLAGFGIGAGGGLSSSSVAKVGDRDISAQEYARAFDSELRAISQQFGRTLTVEEARALGLDRNTLTRLVNERALSGEADRLGLSTGDDLVRERLEGIPGFQGSEGFDRDAYAFFLDRSGLSASEFESSLREEATRTLLVTGLSAGTVVPDTAARTLLEYAGEKRGFSWVRLNSGLLEEPVAEPDDAALATWHEEHPGLYTSPVTQKLSYAAAIPEEVAADTEISEEELQAEYEARKDTLGTPEQRFLDRIGFGTMEEATEAKSRLDSGDAGFDEVATERGLSISDTELGLVTALEIDQRAREAVFSADGPGIIGPVETDLGPAIYRVNAVIAEQTVSFEEAKEDIRQELATELARSQILEEIRLIDDLIAGGARLEEITEETIMRAGSIALNANTTGGLSDDPAFRDLAANARKGEETDLAELEGGGLVTVRLEETVPASLIPLAEVRDQVEADWKADATRKALTAQAEQYAEAIASGESLESVAEGPGLTVEISEPVTRNDVVPGLPPRLLADVFTLEDGDTAIIPDGDGVILVQLTSIEAADPEDETTAGIEESITQQISDMAAVDLLTLYNAAVRDSIGVTVNQGLIDSTLSQF
ncbi:SurA N-terminal domain-containing protein [Amaricoccus tamworthensis]|uniref:peptidylprolyl isomerase n=1 Tax=Amaricoccus tamworthensis TaxID=57002 RepID=UPI003C7EAF86